MSTMAPPQKPRRPRRQFDEDFKASAVRFVLDNGKSVDEGHESSILPSPRFAIGSITGERIARKAEPA